MSPSARIANSRGRRAVVPPVRRARPGPPDRAGRPRAGADLERADGRGDRQARGRPGAGRRLLDRARGGGGGIADAAAHPGHRRDPRVGALDRRPGRLRSTARAPARPARRRGARAGDVSRDRAAGQGSGELGGRRVSASRPRGRRSPPRAPDRADGGPAAGPHSSGSGTPGGRVRRLLGAASLSDSPGSFAPGHGLATREARTKSLRKGLPSNPSGRSSVSSSPCPAKSMPNISCVSRSCQSAAG